MAKISKDELSKIYGKIKFVDSFPDYKVKIVDNFACKSSAKSVLI